MNDAQLELLEDPSVRGPIWTSFFRVGFQTPLSVWRTNSSTIRYLTVDFREAYQLPSIIAFLSTKTYLFAFQD